MATDLALDGVTLICSGNTLVDGLDMVIAPGQTLIVARASKAGETTLPRAISDFGPCDHGSVTRPEGRLT